MTDDNNYPGLELLPDIDEISFLKLTLKQEMIKILIKFVALFYMVYGVFVTYIWTCKELDVKSRNNTIVYYFWDPVITIYSFGNFSVLVMIGLSKWWSYKNEEKRHKERNEDYITVCFILIPLFVASFIINVIKLVRDIAIIPCHGYLTFLVPLSTLALIIGAAILIFDLEYLLISSKNWFMNEIKYHLIIFTTIGIANTFILTIALQQMDFFISQSANISHVYNNSCASSLDSTSTSIEDDFEPLYTLFLLCTLIYLIQPLLESEIHNKNNKSSTNNSMTSSSIPELSIISENTSLKKEKYYKNVKNVSFRLPSASLLFCISFIGLSFVSFIVMHISRKIYDSISYESLGILISSSFISITYIVGSGLSVVHIKEVQGWPVSSNNRGNVIHKYLMWIGAGGQFILSITFISNSLILLVVKRLGLDFIAVLYITIFISVLALLQIILQTFQISLILDRKWIRPKINSLVESLCPPVGMMGLNISLLLYDVDKLKYPVLNETSGIQFVDMFTDELGTVGRTLSILQRIHASLLFASMIVYT